MGSRGSDNDTRDQSDLRRGSQSQECGQPLEARRSKEQMLQWSLQIQPCTHLDFSPKTQQERCPKIGNLLIIFEALVFTVVFFLSHVCFKCSMIKSKVKGNCGLGDQDKHQGDGTREGFLLGACLPSV